ncbi:hypothetical protein QQ25_28900 [Mycolicibacterium setense]|nr:hypothetical protein QQ25_28900 [Mycolicibacterium setense]
MAQRGHVIGDHAEPLSFWLLGNRTRKRARSPVVPTTEPADKRAVLEAAGKVGVERRGVFLRLVAPGPGLGDLIEDQVHLIQDLSLLLEQRRSGLALVHALQRGEDLVDLIPHRLCVVGHPLNVVEGRVVGAVLVCDLVHVHWIRPFVF